MRSIAAIIAWVLLPASAMAQAAGGGGGAGGVDPTTLAHPPYIANNWYLPIGAAATAAAAPANSNAAISCFAGSIASAVTIGSLAFNVATLFAGGNAQSAVYNDANGRPGTLVATAASQLTTTTGIKIGALTANKQVGPGTANGSNLWFCTNMDNSTALLTSAATTSSVGATTMGAPTAAGSLLATQGYSCAGANCAGGSSTFGTWPATLAGSTWTLVSGASIPFVSFQVVSVP